MEGMLHNGTAFFFFFFEDIIDLLERKRENTCKHEWGEGRKEKKALLSKEPDARLNPRILAL